MKAELSVRSLCENARPLHRQHRRHFVYEFDDVCLFRFSQRSADHDVLRRSA